MDKKEIIANLIDVRNHSNDAEYNQIDVLDLVISALQTSVVLSKEQGEKIWHGLNVYVGDNEDIHEAELEVMRDISEQLSAMEGELK